MSDSDSLPPILLATTSIPASRVATLFSSPVPLVSAIPGKLIVAVALHVRAHAGVAWSTGGSGILAVRYKNAPTVREFGHYDQTTTDTFFDGREQVWVAEAGKGQVLSFGNYGIAGSVQHSNDSALEMALGTADISGGTGKLTVKLFYRVWDGV